MGEGAGSCTKDFAIFHFYDHIKKLICVKVFFLGINVQIVYKKYGLMKNSVTLHDN